MTKAEAVIERTLEHYGIKGMKWGVRRSQEELDRLAGRTPRKSRRARTSEARSMSDTELRSRINRIQMEQQYVKLTAPKTNAGAKFVKDLLANSGKNIASAQLAKYGGKAVDLLIEQALKRK